MMRLSIHSLIVGLALFSMFFGAGNTIFPPYVGLASGPDWFSAFLCYYMADIGLALVAIFAMLNARSIDKVEGIMFRLGDIPAKLMMSVIVICIGPLLAMPRTGATTFSMTLAPILGPESLLPQVLFSIVFFGLAFVFAFRESSLVDLVGRYLTPLLVAALLLLIGAGVIFPIGPISEAPQITNVTSTAISSGYQTMDVLAAVIFGLIVVNAVKSKGYSNPKQQFMSVGIASLVAGFFLFIVYGGLCYLGATVSTLYPESIAKGELVMNIARHIFGPVGAFILSVIIGLACLTTAIALAGTAGTFFSSLSGGKLPYSLVVTVTCLFSAFVANFGLDNIIELASPILTVVYPGTLVIIFLSLFDSWIKNDNVFRFSAAGAMAVSFCGVTGCLDFIKNLPLHDIGLAWVVPAAVCAVLGAFVRRRSKN